MPLNHKEYQKLIREINRLRNEVNLFNNEEISENALDDLKHKITKYETQNPTKIAFDSPNYMVAGGVATGFEKFTHSRRMLSLNDIFSLKELEEWQERFQSYGKKQLQIEEEVFAQIQPKYICEPKIDGLAISLHYSDGELVAAATRGDGYIGELVTKNVRQIQSIPKQIEDKRKLEVRGEIFITKKDFETLNQEIIDQKKLGKMGKTGKEAVFANPRNATSGTIRQLDSQVVSQRRLSFIAYGIWFEE